METGYQTELSRTRHNLKETIKTLCADGDHPRSCPHKEGWQKFVETDLEDEEYIHQNQELAIALESKIYEIIE
jgi:hypothetical protein